jgi:hypothetical protein
MALLPACKAMSSGSRTARCPATQQVLGLLQATGVRGVRGGTRAAPDHDAILVYASALKSAFDQHRRVRREPRHREPETTTTTTSWISLDKRGAGAPARGSGAPARIATRQPKGRRSRARRDGVRPVQQDVWRCCRQRPSLVRRSSVMFGDQKGQVTRCFPPGTPL